MRLSKSLLTAVSVLAVSTGAAFAESSMSYDAGGLESGDREYFAESQGAMTDPITSANSGEMLDYDVYYIVPMEVVEVEEVWLIPSGDSGMPQG